MKYVKIDRDNRYFDIYFKLEKIISIGNYFEREYNADKERHYANYSKPLSKFNSPITESKILIDEIQDFFNSNLLSYEEQKLLIYNLILEIENYGSDTIKMIISSQDKEIFGKYGIEFNGQISEKMIIDELSNFPTFENTINNILELRQMLKKELINLDNEVFKEITLLLKAIPPQQTETKTEQQTIEAKPIFNPKAVQIVFEIIKDFFGTEQQNELKQVLETGNNASQKLLFKDSGNRLTNTFKKLIEHDFITGCQKQDLINWVVSNFDFTHQNKAKAFIHGTVEKTISGNNYYCKSPLIEIENGQIQKVVQPQTKKYNKY